MAKHLLLQLIFVCIVSTAARSESAPPDSPPNTAGDRLFAIDVLLEPDATMVEKAKAANARLRENDPQGYALDASHAPHISLLHAYVRQKDLPEVTAAVDKVLASEQPLKWNLKTTGYEHGVWDGKAITLMMVERSPELMRLEQAIVDAVKPFIAQGGTADAFVTSPDSKEINKQTIDWVTNFVPNASGDKFKPHVTVGVANEDFVKKLKAKPFEPFTFKVHDVAIYQLGNFGTARKKLWTNVLEN